MIEKTKNVLKDSRDEKGKLLSEDRGKGVSGGRPRHTESPVARQGIFKFRLSTGRKEKERTDKQEKLVADNALQRPTRVTHSRKERRRGRRNASCPGKDTKEGDDPMKEARSVEPLSLEKGVREQRVNPGNL